MIIQGVDVANLMSQTLNNIAEAVENKWSDEFSNKKVSIELNKVLEDVNNIDFNKLSYDEMIFLGFRKYGEKSDKLLIPLWLLRAIPNGTKLKSVSGKALTVGIDRISGANRMGLSGYYLTDNQY